MVIVKTHGTFAGAALVLSAIGVSPAPARSIRSSC